MYERSKLTEPRFVLTAKYRHLNTVRQVRVVFDRGGDISTVIAPAVTHMVQGVGHFEKTNVVRDYDRAGTQQVGVLEAAEVGEILVFPVIEENEVKGTVKAVDVFGQSADAHGNCLGETRVSDDASGNRCVAATALYRDHGPIIRRTRFADQHGRVAAVGADFEDSLRLCLEQRAAQHRALGRSHIHQKPVLSCELIHRGQRGGGITGRRMVFDKTLQPCFPRRSSEAAIEEADHAFASEEFRGAECRTERPVEVHALGIVDVRLAPCQAQP